MRNLIFILLILLLGINGLLLWQNREDNRDMKQACCAIPDNMNSWMDDVKTFLLPGGLGLIQ